MREPLDERPAVPLSGGRILSVACGVFGRVVAGIKRRRPPVAGAMGKKTTWQRLHAGRWLLLAGPDGAAVRRQNAMRAPSDTMRTLARSPWYWARVASTPSSTRVDGVTA